MTTQEALETACRAECERMMQDHIRLCTALGLDADANVDMLAEAAEQKQARIAELAALLEPFAAGAEHLPPWAKDDAFVNIDFPYTSDRDFGERWLIDDRVEVHHFKDAAAALKGRRRMTKDEAKAAVMRLMRAECTCGIPGVKEPCFACEMSAGLDVLAQAAALADTLTLLEALAKRYDLPVTIESLVRLYVSDGELRYQDEFSRRNVDRAEVEALLGDHPHG